MTVVYYPATEGHFLFFELAWGSFQALPACQQFVCDPGSACSSLTDIQYCLTAASDYFLLSVVVAACLLVFNCICLRAVLCMGLGYG